MVAVSFHPQLKAADEKRIANLYQENLCTAHKVTCPFHCNKFPKSHPQTTVPSYLGSVMPPEFVDLVEHSKPQALLEERIKTLIRADGEERTPLALHLPHRQMEEFLGNGETAESFVSRLSGALGCHENEQWAAVLALFCWEPTNARSEQVVVMQCRTCLAQCGLRVHDVDDTETDDSTSVDGAPPAKKQRTNQQQMNPIMSHRHYCPVICGFPSDSSTVPMWQTVATNLFRSKSNREEEATTIKGEEIMMKIHRLLQSGLR